MVRSGGRIPSGRLNFGQITARLLRVWISSVCVPVQKLSCDFSFFFCTLSFSVFVPSFLPVATEKWSGTWRSWNALKVLAGDWERTALSQGRISLQRLHNIRGQKSDARLAPGYWGSTGRRRTLNNTILPLSSWVGNIKTQTGLLLITNPPTKTGRTSRSETWGGQLLCRDPVIKSPSDGTSSEGRSCFSDYWVWIRVWRRDSWGQRCR